MNDSTISLAKGYFKSFIPSIESFFPDKKLEISIREKGGGEDGAILKIAPPELFEIIKVQHDKLIGNKQFVKKCEFSFKPPEIITNIHNEMGTACIFFLLNEVQAILHKDKEKEFAKKITTAIEIKKQAEKILEEQYKGAAKIISCLYQKKRNIFHIKISLAIKRKGNRKIKKIFTISGRNEEDIISLLEHKIAEKKSKQSLQ